MVKTADFDDLDLLGSWIYLLPSTRSGRSVVGSHLSELTIIHCMIF